MFFEYSHYSDIIGAQLTLCDEEACNDERYSLHLLLSLI